MSPNVERVQLVAPGSLGTCWYGKYHYLEPWVGCEHNCPYCYARSRMAVRNSLAELGTNFANPQPLLPRQELLEAIERQANSGQVSIFKLSRYTDIFSPRFVADGLSYEILEILAKSRVSRVIITTKGAPDRQLLELLARYPQKFSYNAACRPSSLLDPDPLPSFEKNLLPLRQRLEAAAQAQEAGLLTTIHCDPFVAQVDDQPQALQPFLDLLESYKLKRVMWSYLLLSPTLLESMPPLVDPKLWSELLERYDLHSERQVLPGQEDTISFAQKNDVALESVDKVAKALMARNFQFVLCSLKSIRGLNLREYPRQMLCNGTFYA